LSDQSIELVDYNPSWINRFVEQQQKLQRLLERWLAGRIEHIGSTSIPGLRAKPIVDIAAPVRSLTCAQSAISILAKDGWLFWAGDPNRHYRLWFVRPHPSARTHHLQLIQHNCPDLRALVSFRDALRNNPDLRNAYADLKEALAKAYQTDRDRYTNAKSDFVRSVLRSIGPVSSSRLPT
jgi:GrpB-like predicted nucleotidyltransferase (UPF0157 family)